MRAAFGIKIRGVMWFLMEKKCLDCEVEIVLVNEGFFCVIKIYRAKRTRNFCSTIMQSKWGCNSQFIVSSFAQYVQSFVQLRKIHDVQSYVSLENDFSKKSAEFATTLLMKTKFVVLF